MSEGLNVLSLFDGMSCGYEALTRAGIPVKNYYASEIDVHSIKVAKHNHPDIQYLGDVRDWQEWDIKNIDLLIGGSPCTDLSFSGHQRGLKACNLEEYNKLKSEGFEFDGQSYLFWEYINILKQFKPKYFLLENVLMKKEYENIITNVLGVTPIYINSADFCAQTRQRLYWTNIPLYKSLYPEKSTLLLKDIMEDENDVPLNYFTNLQPHRKLIINSETNRRMGYHGKATRSSRFYNINYKSSALCTCNVEHYVVPLNRKIDKKIFRFNIKNQEYTIRVLIPLEMERLQTLTEGYTAVEGVSNTQRFRMIGNGWTVDVIKYILSGLNKELDLPEDDIIEPKDFYRKDEIDKYYDIKKL